MTSGQFKPQDQILLVPSHIDRRGRSARQLAEEEATTEEGFVTSVRQQTASGMTVAFCRFYRPDGHLRTVANSEACNLDDLMRNDTTVLTEALGAFAEGKTS